MRYAVKTKFIFEGTFSVETHNTDTNNFVFEHLAANQSGSRASVKPAKEK
jgi:hypothetical protein